MHNAAVTTELKPAGLGQVLEQLPYFVEWRPRLWAPAVRWLVGEPERFQGKLVLDVGCRYGRMSCFFALLGAEVVGVDMPGVSLERARQEAERWGVQDRVHFFNYDGLPTSLPRDGFDFVFTKSVLVVVPDLDNFLRLLAAKMSPEGELLMAENLSGGSLLHWVRRVVIHRRWKTFGEKFHGVDAEFIATLGRIFAIRERKDFCWLVAALRAQRR